jgi:hypothetical protein
MGDVEFWMISLIINSIKFQNFNENWILNWVKWVLLSITIQESSYTSMDSKSSSCHSCYQGSDD